MNCAISTHLQFLYDILTTWLQLADFWSLKVEIYTKVWVKEKTRFVQKLAISKKSAYFVLSIWYLVQMIASWVSYFLSIFMRIGHEIVNISLMANFWTFLVFFTDFSYKIPFEFREKTPTKNTLNLETTSSGYAVCQLRV